MSFSFDFITRTTKDALNIILIEEGNQGFIYAPATVRDFITTALFNLLQNGYDDAVHVKANGHLHNMNDWMTSNADISVRPLLHNVVTPPVPKVPT